MDWDGTRFRGGRTLGVAVALSLLGVYACGRSTGASDSDGMGGSGVGGGGTDDAGGSGGAGPSGGTSGTATSSGGGNGSNGGGSGGSMAPAGAGGEAGAAEGSSTSGGAGAPALTCVPDNPPDASCEYPESPGGGSDSDACGVTPGAWFGIGESSELTTWPTRATTVSATEGVLGAFREKSGTHQFAFDPTGMPLVLWQEEDPAGGFVMRIHRWDGSTWAEVATRHQEAYPVEVEFLVDSTGRPLVVEQSGAGVEVSRFADSAWETFGAWPLGRGFGGVVLDAADRPAVVFIDYSLATDDDPTPPFVVQRWTGSTWETSVVPDQNIYPAKLALRANGDLVVAFRSQDDKIMLRQWSGGDWIELDGSASGSGLFEVPEDVWDPDIALEVDAADQVIVVWRGSYRVWNGSAWSAPGSVGGLRPRLARNSAGELYLISDSDLDDAETLQERLFYRWTNDGWESLPPTAAEYTEQVDLAVAPDGTAGMAFGYQQVLYRSYADGDWSELESPAGTDMEVDRASYPGVPEVPAVLSYCMLGEWNGSTWEVIAPPTDATDCDYARNANADAYLAFWAYDVPSFRSLRVARQTANGWELVGAPEFEVGLDDDAIMELAIDSQGHPVLAWQVISEYQHYDHVLGWNGSSWASWGGSSSVPLPSDDVHGLRFALTSDDRPVLAQLQSDHDARLRRLQVSEWTGEDWRVSEAMTRSIRDDAFGIGLAIDATGAPVVSWPSQTSLEVARWSGSEWEQLEPTDEVLASLPNSLRVDVATSSDEVLLRRFEDCAWRGISASDRDGGVSNSSTDSSYREFWATDHSVCIHWTEFPGGTPNGILSDLMRCHDW